MQTRGRLDSHTFLPAAKSGFTITELIAVISILAMVLAIAIPTLSSIYSRARSVIGEANLRTHAQVLSMYANDNAGWMPYFGKPGPDPIGFEFENQSSFPVMFFDTHRFWHLWISEEYYDQSILDEVFRAPWDEDKILIESAYLYPCVYLASPSYWRAESRMVGDSQLRGTRIENVRFPSRKSLVVLPPNIQAGEGVRLRKVSYSAADGSVSSTDFAKVVGGYPRGDGPEHQQWGAVHPVDAPVMLHTVDGIHGVDVSR